jgi:uncharacterized protein HemY
MFKIKLLFAKKQYKEVKDYINEQLIQFPNSAFLLLFMGTVLMEHFGEYEEAAVYVDKALDIENSSNQYYYKAKVLWY